MSLKQLFCPECNQMRSYFIKEEPKTEFLHGESVTATINVARCACCGGLVWDMDLNNKNIVQYYNAFRKIHGLLSLEEVTAIQEQYCEDPALFDLILGFPLGYTDRIEHGFAQDVSQNNLIMLMRDPNNFKALLIRNNDRLSEDDYARLLKKVEAIIADRSEKRAS